MYRHPKRRRGPLNALEIRCVHVTETVRQIQAVDLCDVLVVDARERRRSQDPVNEETSPAW